MGKPGIFFCLCLHFLTQNVLENELYRHPLCCRPGVFCKMLHWLHVSGLAKCFVIGTWFCSGNRREMKDSSEDPVANGNKSFFSHNCHQVRERERETKSLRQEVVISRYQA